MAAKKKAKPVNPHHLTAKQLAADRANLAKARAVAATRKRSAKQVQAARQNLVKARAAQRSRRAGKTPVTAKKAQAPDDSARSGVSIEEVSLHSLPACAAVAVAATLWCQTGTELEAAEIWSLYRLAGSTTLAGVIEAAASTGLAGYRIASWTPWDPDIMLDGLIYGIAIEEGYHAVLTVPGGMLSWDTVLPLAGTPQEAWLIEWTSEPAA